MPLSPVSELRVHRAIDPARPLTLRHLPSRLLATGLGERTDFDRFMVSRASLPVLRYMTGDLKVPPTELTRADLWTLHLPSCRRHGKTCDLVLATTGVRWLQLGEDAVPFETTTKRVQAHLKSICGHSARRNFQRDGESEDAVDLAELPFRLRPATPPPRSHAAEPGAAESGAAAAERGATGSGAAMEVEAAAAESSTMEAEQVLPPFIATAGPKIKHHSGCDQLARCGLHESKRLKARAVKTFSLSEDSSAKKIKLDRRPPHTRRPWPAHYCSSALSSKE